ncbi:MAG: hydrogenase maturation protease [Bacteroidetes bacterium]|nr:hydrogenase maturation protease [Bacteroidota bacterium]
MNNEKILVLGIGNVLMEDEGAGVEVIRRLENENLPENVEILDGGTGGFHLLTQLGGYKVIIMVDATLDNDEEGTIKLTEPKFATDFPKALSAHDIGLKDLVESLILLNEFPKIYLFTISIKHFHNVSMQLSPAIQNAIPQTAEKVVELIDRLNQSLPK